MTYINNYIKYANISKQIELCLEHRQIYTDFEYEFFNTRHMLEKYEIDPYIIIYDDNSTKELYYNDLTDFDKFNVKNQLCNTGYDSFYINIDSDIYQCKSHFFDKKKCIGNIKYMYKSNIKYKRIIYTCKDCYTFHIYKKKLFV